MREILQSEGIFIAGGGVSEAVALGGIAIMAILTWNVFYPHHFSSKQHATSIDPFNDNYDYNTLLYLILL